MRSIAGQLNAVLSSREKKQIAGLIIMMFFGGIMELLGVSLVFPLISVAMDTDSGILNRLTAAGVDMSRYELIIALAVSLMVIYVLKNLYLTFMYHRIFSFIKLEVYSYQRIIG